MMVAGRATVAWLFAGTALLTVAACGGNSARRSDAGTPARRAGVPGRQFDAGLWRFYRYSGREPGVADVIDRAEQVSEARRMRRAGFREWPVDQWEPPHPVLDGLPDVPGPTAPPQAAVLRTAREKGFGIRAQPPSRPSTAPQANSAYFSSLSPAAQARYQLALRGKPNATIKVYFPDGSHDTVPTHGCQSRAARRVYGSLARDDFRLNAVALVQHMVDNRVGARPAVAVAMRRWSRCLRRRSGHAFKTPAAVQNWLMERYSQDGAGVATVALERRYATMSTSCAYATRLTQRYAAATWSVLQAMPAAWYRAIVHVHAWNARAVRRARAILR